LRVIIMSNRTSKRISTTFQRSRASFTHFTHLGSTGLLQSWLCAVLLCAGLSIAPSFSAHAQTTPSAADCHANGGSIECIKAERTFQAQVGLDFNRYPNGLAACRAAVAHIHGVHGSDSYLNAAYVLHSTFGPGCEYDVILNGPINMGRQYFQGWVLSAQQCRQLNGQGDVGGWTAADGTRWCQYDTPIDEHSCTVGSPVLPGTGREALAEVDYVGAGAHPLSIVRNYRSFWAEGVAVPLAASAGAEGGWALSVHARIGSELDNRIQPTRRVSHPNGQVASFYGTPSAPGPKTWRTLDGSGDRLVELRDAAGALTGWQLSVFDDDSVETYDAAGKLLQAVARNGWVTTYAYSTAATPVASYISGASGPQIGQLISVRNHFARQINLVYDPQGRISQLLPPGAVKDLANGGAASPIRYQYSELASLGNTPAANQLTSITWQDGTSRRYHYDDPRFPHALTGTTDEAGVRVVSRLYDSVGRVREESKIGGADRLEFRYIPATRSEGSLTVVTDYTAGRNQASRDYLFQA
jgi:hypothetical protein